MTKTRAAACVLACFLPGACSIPTDLPVVDSRWVLEVQSTTIGVDGLLPAGVTLAGTSGPGGGRVFAAEIAPVTEESSLASLCTECPETDEPVFKPAFTGRITARAPLPADVSSAGLVSGAVALRLRHDFSFDPIRPPGGNRGRLTVSIAEAGGREIGRLELRGDADSLPPDRIAEHDIVLAAGLIEGELSMSIEIESPEGGRGAESRVRLGSTDRFVATAAPSDLRLSAAHVAVVGRRVSIEPAEIGVEGVDGGIVDRIQSGAVVFDIANAFRAGLDATMHIRRDGQAVVSKDFTVGDAANSTVSLELTADEFRSFLGQPGVTLVGSGVVTSPAGGIVVTPEMVVDIGGKVDLTVRVGG